MRNKKKQKVLIITVIIIAVLSVVVCVMCVQKFWEWGEPKGDKSDSREFSVAMNEVFERIESEGFKVYATEETSTGFSTNDWTSFEVCINDKIYTWPITYAQLVDDGYVLHKEDIDYEAVEEKYDSMGHRMYNESDKTICLSVAFKGYVLPDYDSPDCYAYKLSIVKGFIVDYSDFTLCNGIRLDASYDEVVAIMGWEEEKNYYTGSGDNRFDVTYENEDKTRRMCLTFVNDKLETIDLYEIE